MSAISFKLDHHGAVGIRPSALQRLACILVMLAGVGLCTVASAGDTLAGSGNTVCESYLTSDDDARLASDSWVLGFLSSANLRARNLDLLANQSNGIIIDALENYCEANPDALVADAAVELLKSLADSAAGECTGAMGAEPPRGKLSICHTAGAVEGQAEPANFSLTLPGVE